jgi:hypothetical protein
VTTTTRSFFWRPQPKTSFNQSTPGWVGFYKQNSILWHVKLSICATNYVQA